MKYKLILIFYLLSVTVFSQSLKQYVRTGNKAFKAGNYIEAKKMYKRAIQMNNNILEVQYKYAESCRLLNEYKEAEKYYRKVSSSNITTYPLSLFWLAEVLKNQGQYQKAQYTFKSYIDKHSSETDYYALKANHEIYSCEKANLMMFDIKPINIIKLDTVINSSFSELSSFEINDSLLYFSSYRPKNDSLMKDFKADVYLSKMLDSVWSTSELIDTVINKKLENISNFSFSKDLKTVYFSKCIIDNDISKSCKIYKAEFDGKLWSNISELPSEINLQGFVNTQPYLATTAEGSYLMFSSNRSGGIGKKDIWFSKILQDGSYDKPQNIGKKINTYGDEISPYYSTKDSMLYFSSEWYENLGGYDIFKVKGDFYYWNKPENLGYPINTTYNELYYEQNTIQSKAYFTSNRKSEGKSESEHCCNDIYYYKLPTIKKDTVIPEIEIKEIVLKDIKELIPITLYFHNDEPNPKTKDTITQFNYTLLFENYIKMIDEYKKEFSTNLKSDAKSEAEYEIDEFFSNYVETGYNKLESFAQRLEILLSKGENVVITLKGYTSPLNTADYNNRLAKRRIYSLKNYFMEYNNGVFEKYLNNNSEKANYLKFELQAIGEELANKNISDDLNDKRNSVYSPNAAMERKIQIIAISVP
ncbi:MAG: hypothetical protein A2046_06405 [Bacteroidetes bacterium GWA2_30_7]|nr:MAG: hypothetical protein A2046_06405 [Bacteroidetes bacterium GWA2_30_7]